MRQYTYREAYDYSHIHAFHNPNVDLLDHVEHCLEMLRVKIMCDADPTMYPVVEDINGGWRMEMKPKRVCRNFPKMVERANSHINVPFDRETEG